MGTFAETLWRNFRCTTVPCRAKPAFDSANLRHSPTDSLDGSQNAAVTHFEMSDASFRQGALYALVYVIFALTITATAVWVWPRLGPWFWAHI
jgi:hypothetical protein